MAKYEARIPFDNVYLKRLIDYNEISMRDLSHVIDCGDTYISTAIRDGLIGASKLRALEDLFRTSLSIGGDTCREDLYSKDGAQFRNEIREDVQKMCEQVEKTSVLYSELDSRIGSIETKLDYITRRLNTIILQLQKIKEATGADDPIKGIN